MEDIAMKGTGESATVDDGNRVVLPGDDATDFISSCMASMDGSQTTVKLGVGLEQHGETVTVTKAGILSFKKPNRFYVLSTEKRYAPSTGDTVIGVVVDKNAEYYKIKLNATTSALLPLLAFDGATKRNKPSYEAGALVFARVAACSRYMEPELSCTAISGPKKDWMTGESLFGELRGGTMIKVATGYARRLLSPDCAVLAALGRSIPFELAVGLNGYVYVQANSVKHTVSICNAIEKSEHLTDSQAELLVHRILSLM